MYYNFTTDAGVASQQIHNTCIGIPKKRLNKYCNFIPQYLDSNSLLYFVNEIS